MSDQTTTHSATDGLNPQQQALLGALSQVLEPLADLCVGQGVAIQAVEEVLRHAMVRAARQASEGANPQRLTSRISTMTGLTRREVARIEQSTQPARPASRSLVTEIFTRWAFEPEYRDADNRPMRLPRVGPAPSFEALAHRVTRDVHPRSLLAEMQRLGLVGLDGEAVRLLRDTLVPQGDWVHMVGFLGDNVGDHLRAATSNVLGQGLAQFEQSVLADELSTESLAQAKLLVNAQWQALMSAVVPQLEALMQADRAAGRTQDQALRLGMFALARPMTEHERQQCQSSSPERQ